MPISKNSEHLIIDKDQRRILNEISEKHPLRKKAFLVSFPGDEEIFGGCLASGRGFAHISADGYLEPCPFAPYSDRNVKDTHLKDALESGLLKSMRANPSILNENEGGCALWKNSELMAFYKRNNGKSK